MDALTSDDRFAVLTFDDGIEYPVGLPRVDEAVTGIAIARRAPRSRRSARRHRNVAPLRRALACWAGAGGRHR
ncbi:conserved membrane domain protein [Mycobacterium ulcerans str. Harvey]|uniref:Conserved membrane domain protein n=1 Tax=Mycobacterium ulcerans str. Harvey TaxID=1299332 RepID=A0ABN0RA29_MYCUL|nr:conserved membrane domain protein [Mycobacterium ulcerans str. Harvey]